MSHNLALQKALRAVLIGRAELVALVPSGAILDRNARPNPSPSIILGETQELDGGFASGGSVEIFHTVHIWKQEPSLAGVRRIGWEIRQALRAGRVQLESGFHLVGWTSTARYIRDPDGVTSHGIVTVAATITGGGL
ncbi:MAG: hypothetical protein A3D16_09940 [Rhodobacterales bacterium RIFCSPHIGHO2_02_FULL_62_130]|nr:MAG: hypothetical protein A3D16_09940 [Rhodobacterales bacterium RIFCSPHIGHO2_02_FULL_62_130]OHC56332.1 MAG: hypothetical protein A3E48_20865 [Rhodobacterales bacterium RIFCSPHIGHO2_12_FULL_62_75]